MRRASLYAGQDEGWQAGLLAGAIMRGGIALAGWTAREIDWDLEMINSCTNANERGKLIIEYRTKHKLEYKSEMDSRLKEAGIIDKHGY